MKLKIRVGDKLIEDPNDDAALAALTESELRRVMARRGVGAAPPPPPAQATGRAPADEAATLQALLLAPSPLARSPLAPC